MKTQESQTENENSMENDMFEKDKSNYHMSDSEHNKINAQFHLNLLKALKNTGMVIEDNESKNETEK